MSIENMYKGGSWRKQQACETGSFAAGFLVEVNYVLVTLDGKIPDFKYCRNIFHVDFQKLKMIFIKVGF